MRRGTGTLKIKCVLDIRDSCGDEGRIAFILRIDLRSVKNFYNQVYDHLDKDGLGSYLLETQLRRKEREVVFFTVKAFYEIN